MLYNIDILILGKKCKFNLFNFVLKKYLIFMNIIYYIYIIYYILYMHAYIILNDMIEKKYNIWLEYFVKNKFLKIKIIFK